MNPSIIKDVLEGKITTQHINDLYKNPDILNSLSSDTLSSVRNVIIYFLTRELHQENSLIRNRVLDIIYILFREEQKWILHEVFISDEDENVREILTMISIQILNENPEINIQERRLKKDLLNMIDNIFHLSEIERLFKCLNMD